MSTCGKLAYIAVQLKSAVTNVFCYNFLKLD
jgi:hypothetical protein